MPPARPMFDPEAPFVARRTITRGSVVTAQDAPFDWRALGVGEVELLRLWGAGWVDNVSLVADAGPAASLPDAVPPAPIARLSRAERRASARS